MPSLEVILPGGLPQDGRLERRARFRPVDGRMELALIELAGGEAPSYVSGLLEVALEHLGSQPADADRINALCVADRQYLMLRLAAMLAGEQLWLKAICGRCGAPFDIEIRRCDLPVKPAGETFPVAKLQLPAGEVEVRVPSARDQLEIVELPDDEATRLLLRRCIVGIDGGLPDAALVEGLSGEDVAAIDAALDELSPAVCSEVLVTCPECRTDQRASLNHYQLPGLTGEAFFDEIHALAMHYHWSEQEILDMPRVRRQRYLKLIDRSRSMTGQVT